MPELQDRQPTFEDLNAVNLPYLEAVVHETLRLSRTAGGYARESEHHSVPGQAVANEIAKKDVTVLGHRIPKGTTVVFTTATGTEDLTNPTAASLSPTAAPPVTDVLIRHTEALADVRYDSSATRKVGYWAAGTGHLFDPERWMTSKGEFDPYAGPSMPFSLGQRGCFGKNLAVRVPWASSMAKLISQMLELRLFMAQLSLAFFFGQVPDTMNSTEFFEKVANHPRQSYIRPMSWECAEAQAQVLA
jgi:cytochrome P450